MLAPARTPERLTVALLDERITVECVVDDVMPWLREMLLPALLDCDHAGSRLTVSVGTAPSNAPVGGATSMPCFSLGESVVWLPSRRTGSALVVDDGALGARYTIKPEGVEISPIGPRPRLWMGALRVVRELVAAHPPGAARVELHAAGLVSRGRAVLFAGPKGAGKTTVLAKVLASSQCGLLAGDCVVVSRGGSEFRAHAMPTVVSVRRGTLALLPELSARLLAASPIREDPARNIYLTPARFARTLERPVEGPSKLGCVVFVTVDPATEAFVLRPVAPTQAESRIRAVCRRDSTGSAPPTVFAEALGHSVSPGDSHSLIGELASELPCFELQVGERFVEEQELARDLLTQLTRGW